MCVCGGGACVWGLCPVGSLSRGVSFRETSQTETQPHGHEQAVHIQLECILVVVKITHLNCFISSSTPNFIIPEKVLSTFNIGSYYFYT